MHLEHLTDVHTGRHAQRVEHDVERRAVRQVRHILTREDAGHDTLVAVAACHLVADGDLTLLRDVHAHDLVDTGGHLVAVFAGEALDVDHDAGLAVRDLERGVADFSRLLAEDGAQQALLGGQIGLALRRDLADQNITAAHLCTDADDAAVVEILERIVADAGDVTGDLLGPELRVARIALELFNMNGGVDVLHDQTLVDENGVLVVVAFPGHEADQQVLAERDLALRGGRTVGNDVALAQAVADGDDRALVDARALVGTGKLDELVVLDLAAVVAHLDVVGRHSQHNAVALGENDHAGVHAQLVLDACGDDRRLCDHQRHGLTLHVRAHEGTVRVVVFQERDHGRRDGDHHARGDVDIVDAVAVDLDDLVAVAAGDTVVDEAAVFIDRLARLRDDVAVLDVRRHVLDIVGHTAGALFHAAERRHEEAVLVHAGVGREVADQTDVRTFRRLDRAHTAVVAVVHVTHIEACALTRQAAGAECGDTALVRQLCQRVGLVHELGQRAAAEKLLDGGRHGTDVDERLRGDHVEILQRHALTDHALHAAEADAELILQQLAHAAHAAVAEVVDVIRLADAVRQAAQIVDGREHIVGDDVLRDEQVDVLLNGFLERVALVLLHELAQDDAAHELLDAELGRVEVNVVLHIDHAVAEHADGLAIHVQIDVIDAGLGDLLGALAREHLARLGDDLAGHRIDDRSGQHMAGDAAAQAELFVELIAADIGNIVAAAVVEQALKQGLGALHRRGIARTELAVDLDECLLAGVAGVLVEGGDDARIVIEHFLDLLVGDDAGRHIRDAGQPGVRIIRFVRAHGLDEPGHRQLAVFIDAAVEDVVEVSLVLEPCAVVRDDGRAVGGVVGLVGLLVIVHAGGTHDLRDDDTLRAVDDEGAAGRHDREIAHEDLLLFDLLGLLVAQADADLQRGRIRGVARFALLLGVLRILVHGVIHEAQLEVAGVVGDDVHILEHITQALFEEPFVRILLDLQKIRHALDLLVTGKAHSFGFSVGDCLWHGEHSFF